MQAPAHIAISWLIGERAGLTERRDRRIVGLSGIFPDLDVVIYPLGYVFYGGDLDRAFDLYASLHHRYSHGLGFAVLTATLAWMLATTSHRVRVALLAGAVVALHVVCDLIAAGTAWPVYPLWPIDSAPWTVEWSWQVSDWRNVALSAGALAMTLAYARWRGYSPIECFSYRADAWVHAVMHGRVRSTRRFRIVLYAILAVITTAIVVPLLLYLR